MKNKIKHTAPNNDVRQMEADKTARLRALRLAKEAEDRETAARLAAVNPKAPRRRSRSEGAPSDQEMTS
jgi:hypothetical protein